MRHKTLVIIFSVLLAFLPELNICAEWSNSKYSVQSGRGISDMRPRSRRPGRKGQKRRGRPAPSFGPFYDIFGVEAMDAKETVFEIWYSLVSDYSGFQKSSIEKVMFLPSNPEIAEIVTDAAGTKFLHLRYSHIKRGTKVVIYYKGRCEQIKTRGDNIRQLAGISIPDTEQYPQDVRKYLHSGTGIEITGELAAYAKRLAGGSMNFKNVVSAIVRELDKYPFGPNTNNQSCHTEFPPVYFRTASQVYRDKKAVCVEISRLACALLRANNIPARTVTKMDNSTPFNHTWIQVFAMGIGWIDADPLFGSFPKRVISPYQIIDPDENDAFEIRFTTNPEALFRLMKSEELEGFKERHAEWGVIEVLP